MNSCKFEELFERIDLEQIYTLYHKVTFTMDPSTQPPPPTPPKLPGSSPSPSPQPTQPFQGIGEAIGAVLRQPHRLVGHFHRQSALGLTLLLLFVAMCCGLVYGLVVGTFSGGVQLWAAPFKVAGGFLLSAMICLPSLYVFSCLAGSQVRWTEMCGLVAGVLSLMTMLLIGFAPVAWIFSQSTDSVLVIGLMHLLFWAIAIRFGLRFLNVGFGILGDASGGLKVWAAIFVLVMLQMMTTLRPIVGTASTLLPTEKRFFVAHWFQVLHETRTGAAGR